MEIPWTAGGLERGGHSALAPATGTTPVAFFAGLGWRATGGVLTEYVGSGVPLVAFDYPRRWPRRQLDSLPALARIYAEALDRLGLARVRLAGVSLGGMLALHVALERPDLVDSLVLVSTASAGGRVVGRWRLPASRAATVLLRDPSFYRLYRKWGPLLVGTATVAGVRDAARLWTDPMSRRKMADLLRAIATHEVTDRLHEIRAPALVVHGRRDAIIPPRAARELANGLPDARLGLVDGAGHFAFVTHRKQVLRELDNFWRGGPRP